MKLEEQVCSLELAKRLKELGVKQESLFWWTPYMSGDLLRWCVSSSRVWKLPSPFYDDIQDCSAFTVAEFGEMLPFEYATLKHTDGSYVGVRTRIGTSPEYLDIKETTEADARAKLIVYLLETKLLTL